MNEIKTILESGDKAAIAKLTREDVLGNMHYAAMLAYYAQYLGQTKMLQHASKVYELIVGYGAFGSKVEIADRFGLPTGIKAGGIGLDIPMSKVVVADHNDRRNFLNYRMQAGMIASASEHQVPQRLYQSTSGGISAVKLLTLAEKYQQKIYTLTRKNMNNLLPKI